MPGRGATSAARSFCRRLPGHLLRTRAVMTRETVVVTHAAVAAGMLDVMRRHHRLQCWVMTTPIPVPLQPPRS